MNTQNNTWFKLFRKITDHEVFNDESAFRVFIWIMCTVDYSKGSMTSGRFWASERLDINPNTYYAILKRLEKKYDLITLSSNNKNTTISVKNWSKYQQDDNTSDNNKITTKQQQNNTTQEYKNKELRKYNSLSLLNSELVKEVASQYSISERDADKIKEDLVLYCKSKGKKYSDYKAALQNWIRRSLQDGKIKKTQVYSEAKVYDEPINYDKIQELKKQAYNLVGKI